MTEQIQTISRPWWSYLRSSVRGLGFAILLIGFWLGYVVHLAAVQRDAVAAIQQAGGRVEYDWEWNQDSRVPNARPWAPAWLVDRIGIDYFGHVIRVDLTEKGSDILLVRVGLLD